MVSADECGRSLRGTAALLNRRADGLAAFDLSERGFWRSFGAILLTLPAYVVALALARHRLGLDVGGAFLFADPGLALRIALEQVASFLAMPLAMIPLARRFGWSERYVPFVIVTNWIGVFGALLLALPGLLFLLGLETAGLTGLFTLVCLALLLHVNWFATKVALRTNGLAAAALTLLALALDLGIGAIFG